MADERISSFITPEAMAELTTAITSLKDIASQIATLNTTAKQAEGVSKQAKNIEELAKASQTLVDVNGQLILKTAQLTDTQKQYLNLKAQLNGTTDTMIAGSKTLAQQKSAEIKLEADLIRLQKLKQSESAKLAKAQQTEAKQIAELNNEYGQLSKAYNEAALRAKNYALTLGSNHPSTIEAIADAKKLGDQLKALDASVGQHQRNVGNYKSATDGLGRSFAQLAGELPSLSNGFRTFASAIGNNLAPFFLEIKNVVAAVKEAKAAGIANAVAQGAQAKEASLMGGASEEAASQVGELAKAQALAAVEGQKGAGVFAALKGALLSFNTLITVAITLFTIFGPKIYEALTKSSKAAEDAEKANKKYAESLNSIEESARGASSADIAHAKVLAAVAADINQSTKTRIAAVHELQKTYPETFGNLRQQAILEGKLGDAVQATTNQLIARAEALAAEKKFAAANEKLYDLTLAQEDAQSSLNDALALGNELNEQALKNSSNERVQNAATRQTKRIRELQADLLKINDEIAKASQEANRFLDDATNAASRAGSTLTTNEPEKKVRERVDKLKGELEKLKDLVIEFGIKLRNPTPEELRKITDEINAQLKIEANSIEFDLFDKDSEEQAKAAAKRLEDILKAHGAEKLKNQADFEKKRKEIIDRAQVLISESSQLGSELGGLSQAFAQQRIQELDSEIKKINEKREAEINAINARGLSEEETRKQIALVNIKADQEEKKLEQEKIQRQRRAAIFDRGITVTQIIANTALAVVKALPNYVLAAIVAASGAAALAKVIATPLPAYEEGTKGVPHKGGPARLFEKGKTEAVIENGKVWFGNQEGIYNLAKGAQVLSQDQLIKLTQQYAVGLPALIPVSGGLGMNTAGLEQEMRSVRQAIEGKPVPHVSIGTGGLEQVVLAGNHTLRYALNIRNGRA